MGSTSMSLVIASILALWAQSAHAQNTSCSFLDITHGATWMNMTWTLHCDIEPDQVDFIDRYEVDMTDLTSGMYPHIFHPYCVDLVCTHLQVDLRPCINYDLELFVNITSNGETNSHVYEKQNFVMDEEIPSEPRRLEASDITSSSISVSWLPPSKGDFCVKEYSVCWTPATVEEQSYGGGCNTTTEESYVITGLTPCVAYNIRINSITFSGQQGKVGAIRAEAGYEQPNQPSNIRLDDSTESYLSFSWDMPVQNTACVEGNGAICIEGNQTSHSFGMRVQPGSQELEAGRATSSVFNLMECTNYVCWVQIPTKGEEILVSEKVDMSTLILGKGIAKPEIVERFPSKKEIDVLWSLPSEGYRCVEGYYVIWESSDYDLYGEARLDVDINSFKIKDLEACAEVSISVFAFSENWGYPSNGTMDTDTAITLTDAPGPVQYLEQDSAQTDMITMCWMPPLENVLCVDGYDFELFPITNADSDRSDEDDFDLQTHERSAATIGKVEPTLTSRGKAPQGECVDISSLTCGQEYRFCISPVYNGDINKGEESCVPAKTEDC